MMWSITIALPYMEFMWQMYHKCKLDLIHLQYHLPRGKKKGKKLENTVPLCQPIVDAIIGKYFLKYFC